MAVDLERLTLVDLTYLILCFNAELDEGKYDDITIEDVHRAIEGKRVIAWLRDRVPSIDTSLLTQKPKAVAEYEEALLQIYGGYAGKERRKWGVGTKGLALLLAWTNEIVAQGWKAYPRQVR